MNLGKVEGSPAFLGNQVLPRAVHQDGMTHVLEGN